jgi:FKBP-type peptidyl-prolyl cis-trans isomerase SlyD
MQFEAGGPDGSRVVTVTAINDTKVTVDANHPLAGETLHFDVKVVSVRAATEDEKKNGLQSSCGCGCGCGDDDDNCGSGGCGSGGCGCGH